MIEQLNKIITDKNNEQNKYSKGLKKVISGVAILALFGILLSTYSSIPFIIAIDNLFASFAGGIISPLIVSGIGAFGAIKTIMGGVKSIKAKRNLEKIKSDEREIVIRLEEKTKSDDAKIASLTQDNQRLQADKDNLLTNYKGMRAAIKAKINKPDKKVAINSGKKVAVPILDEVSTQSLEDEDKEITLKAA